MEKTFIKNLYQIIIFATVEMIIIIPIICMIFMMDDSVESNVKNILIFIILFLILLYFLIGFYWIFQKVEINNNGIIIRLFKKELRKIKWDEVNSINSGFVMRNPVLIIKIKDKKNLNLDYRKVILNEINKYFSVGENN